MPEKTAFPEKSIRVLHLISTLDTGGAEQTLCRLAGGMDRSAFSGMAVSLTDAGRVGRMLGEAGIPVRALDMKKGVPDPRGLFKLARIVKRFRPHIVQGWMYHANLMSLFFQKGRQVVWNIRCSDMDQACYDPQYRLTIRAGALLSRAPQRIVVNSLAGRSYHEHIGYKPRAWEVIPNGFDTALYQTDRPAGQIIRASLDIPCEAFVIGLIARLDPMKDHPTFLEAARLLMQSHPDVRFLLAGKGVSSANPCLRSLAHHTGQPSLVRMLDERDDIPAVLNALDIATSSSISEGLPNAVGEAMATGLPCVVTDAGDSAVLVGDAGIVVPKKDPRALCAAWRSLLDAGPDFRNEMGTRAKKRIMEHYGLRTMIAGYEALYRNLTAGKES